MFNFNLMNRALKDAELKDAFRMLYYIVNKCSLKNSMSVEIFDAEFELALSISPRSTCRFTKKLEERGYIKKEVRGTSQNKLANIYTLIEVNDTPTDSLYNDINKGAKNCDKNVTLTDNANIDGSSDGSSDGRIGILKNNNKINKNINKLINITSGPVDKEIDILTNTTSGPFEINFNKIDKITYTPVVDDTNNEELRNNQIEKRNIDTMNRENEMNERTRMIEMNDNEHTIENDNDNTPTLEDVLRQQSEEQNKLLNEVYQHQHNNYNPEKQQQYQRVFQKSNEAIEKWKQTHSDYIKAEIESYIKVVELLKRDGDISTKQYQAFDKYITSNFNKLYQGHLAFVRNVKYSSTGNINNNSSATAPAQNANKAVFKPSKLFGYTNYH